MRIAFVTILGLICVAGLSAEPVPVRHTEGVVHGFLALRELDGTTIADGDLIQNAHGDRVTVRLVFHFKDGSLHDETAVYSQRRAFRLLSDHLVQKGPTFPRPLDMTIAGGTATARYTNEHGEQKVETERFTQPPDLANGVILSCSRMCRPMRRPRRCRTSRRRRSRGWSSSGSASRTRSGF